jgi:hypothetical protein
MADDHAAVAQEMSVGARIGGASTVVTLVSVAHAFSHAYGALLRLIVPFFLTDLQPSGRYWRCAINARAQRR